MFSKIFIYIYSIAIHIYFLGVNYYGGWIKFGKPMMQVMWKQNCTDKVLYKCIEFKDIAIYWKHATTLSHIWKTPDFLQNLFVEVVDKR